MKRLTLSRRAVLRAAGACAVSTAIGRALGAEQAGGTILEFESALFAAREAKYRHPKIDIINQGFRPVGGSVADFGVAELAKRVHFYYIERRLAEGTPFYPGHEIYFGHASTGDLFEWEVHDPVLLVRPGTWEGAHVWAPCVVRRGDEFIMAYTGINRHISQDIGLASSRDLFEWKRWDSNPISPCKGRPWAAWSPDHISSCRDPSLVEHEGRWYMNYTANTKQGASCIALASTTDFATWQDYGPICVGPAGGYEMRLKGGHPQGSLESANLFHRRGKWHLTVKAKVRDGTQSNWIIESDRPDRFDFAARREFWPHGFGIETVRRRGDRELLATFSGGTIRFGVVDWSQPSPTAHTVATAEELREWQ
ncbi:MAG: hypothetical protein HY718_02955 [Planctomycetes bacterium]|nr:hypothetical protein [Planctomycetota bacterium]